MTTLDYDFFAARLHARFPLAGHEDVVLVLDALELLAPPAPGRLAFSLIFQGPAAPLLEQMTYALVAPEAGVVDIFLVPIGRDAAAVRYQAIFN